MVVAPDRRSNLTIHIVRLEFKVTELRAMLPSFYNGDELKNKMKLTKDVLIRELLLNPDAVAAMERRQIGVCAP